MAEVAVSVDVGPALATSLEADGSSRAALRQDLTKALSELMAVLGIPGSVSVTLSLLSDDLPRGRFMRLSVNDRLCRYPDELPRWIAGYVRGTHVGPAETPEAILADLTGRMAEVVEAPAATPAGGAPRRDDRLTQFVTLTCVEIVKQHPAVLLGPQQAADYCASLRAPADAPPPPSRSWRPDAERLLPIFRAVLDLGISIADRSAVANLLSTLDGRPAEDTVEALIAALVPDTIELHLPTASLRRLTTGPENQFDQFSFLRDGLLVELGVTYPPFRLVPADELKPYSFRFKPTHVSTAPILGLRPEECLVNDTPERLTRLGTEARDVTNPGNGQPGSLVDAELKAQADEGGWTTWDEMGYFILTLAAVLRRHSAMFVNCRSVRARLAGLSAAYPALGEAVTAVLSVEEITTVLRALVAEGISIRDLKKILERLLDYASVRSFQSGDARTDDKHRLAGPELLPFVRSGLRRELKQKYARTTSTVVAYILDPRIEQLLSSANRHLPQEADAPTPPPDEAEREQILGALRAELAHLPPIVLAPVLLTTTDTRAALKGVIADEFPRMAVISYDDLPPDTNVQPVARIALEA